jgi:hypothetical protein
MPASRPRQGQPRRRGDHGDDTDTEAEAPAGAGAAAEQETEQEAEAGAGTHPTERPALSPAEQAALRRKLREKFH